MNESKIASNTTEVQQIVLDMICPLPHAPDARHFNNDIANMREDQRWRERERVRLRLLIEERPSTWLLDRLDALDALDSSKEWTDAN